MEQSETTKAMMEVWGCDDNDLPKFHFAPLDELKLKCEDTEFTPQDFLPKQINDIDTGYDVRAAEEVVLAPGQFFKISLGLKVHIPKGWWLELKPRSSTFMKKCCITHIGTIDEGFPLKMVGAGLYMPDSRHLRPEPLNVKFGERIFQLIPVKRQLMNVVCSTESEIDKMHQESNSTRKGGTGSTGDK